MALGLSDGGSRFIRDLILYARARNRTWKP